MIDFIQGTIINTNPQTLLNNPKFDFTGEFNPDTGFCRKTVKTSFVKDYFKGIEIKVFDTNRITISGSLHKFYNNGAHNYNDFHYSNFQESVEEVSSYFQIDSKNIHLTQLEYGVNITPPLPSFDILKNCLFHEKTEFKNGYVRHGTYKQAFKGQKRLIKCYDKQAQYSNDYSLPNQILRFEVKLLDMYHLRNTHSICTLNDLYNTPFEFFREPLLKAWDSIVFVSPYLDNQEEYLTLSNPQYWYSIFEKSKATIKRHKDNLKELNRIDGKNLKNQILNLIDSKITELQELPLGGLVENRVCLITGISISMQRVDSSLLSVNGLRYYYKHQKRVYLEVKNKYLSKKWVNDDLETQINEIAHNIRNKKSNLTIKKRRFIDIGQLSFAIH